MKPVSSSDLDCYKNFEYHEMLKRRYRDDEDEKDEVERFCNPAFRLEVKRHNDATIFDCQCNDSELTEENANADIPASFRVRRTVTSHIIRKCPASLGDNQGANEKCMNARNESEHDAGHYRGITSNCGGSARKSSSGIARTCGRDAVHFQLEKSNHCQRNANKASDISIKRDQSGFRRKEMVLKGCGCGHCEKEQRDQCACNKPHPKMEKITAKECGGMVRTCSFTPLIRYSKKEPSLRDCRCGKPKDCCCGPPQDIAEVRPKPQFRPPEEPLMMSYPRERVPLEIFERYLRELELGY